MRADARINNDQVGHKLTPEPQVLLRKALHRVRPRSMIFEKVGLTVDSMRLLRPPTVVEPHHLVLPLGESPQTFKLRHHLIFKVHDRNILTVNDHHP